MPNYEDFDLDLQTSAGSKGVEPKSMPTVGSLCIVTPICVDLTTNLYTMTTLCGGCDSNPASSECKPETTLSDCRSYCGSAC